MGDEKSLLKRNTHTHTHNVLTSSRTFQGLCQTETIKCPEISLENLLSFTSCQELDVSQKSKNLNFFVLLRGEAQSQTLSQAPRLTDVSRVPFVSTPGVGQLLQSVAVCSTGQICTNNTVI